MKTLLHCALFIFLASTSLAKTYQCGGDHHSDASYDSLSDGLYWFGPNRTENDYNACQRYVEGENAFFDVNKQKTIIFIHGWQPGMTARQRRINFDATRREGPPDTNLSLYWLEQGWNVGLLYWNQFSDVKPSEPKPSLHALFESVEQAEAKLWPIERKTAFTWLDSQGHSHPDPEDSQNGLAEKYLGQVEKSLYGYQGRLILVGQSLGSQLATILAYRLYQGSEKDPAIPVPEQLVLLDPVFSRTVYHFLDEPHAQYTLQRVQGMIEDMWPVTVSVYRSSLASRSGFFRELDDSGKLIDRRYYADHQQHVILVDLKPEMYHEKDFRSRHTMGLWWYFDSLKLDRIPLKNNPDQSAPFAGLPLPELKKRVMQRKKYTQYCGFFHNQCSEKEISHHRMEEEETL